MHLTVLATAVTAVVLLVVLSGVLAVFGRQLDAGVDDALRVRWRDVSAAVRAAGPQAVRDETYAALYDGGRPLATSTTLRSAETLLPDSAAVGCPQRQLLVERTVQVSGRDEPLPLRVLAGCLPDGRVLAVAASLEPQDEARERLLGVLALAAPVLLALVALTIGRSVRAALRPVGVLTRQAAQISSGRQLGQRLPAVTGDDEIALLARTLGDMLGRLAVAFARERSFVDDASHELRTPIAVLRGEIELALSDLSDMAGVEQCLRAALGEAQRLSRLTEDLLVLARQQGELSSSAETPPTADGNSVTGLGPGAGSTRSGPDSRKDGADVHGLLLDTARRLARSGPLEVRIDCPQPLHARIAPAELERVLTNLVNNAQAAGATTVLLSARPGDDGDDASALPVPGPVGRRLVVLDVEDDGPGFPEAFLPVAFERFSRADTARTRGSGAGLGLAMVRTLVSEAGGAVTADNRSRLGGAAVHVLLPAVSGRPSA